MVVSKSKYLTFVSCPKAFWLLLNKPWYAKEDPTAKKQIKDGKEVGELAKQYFPNTVDVTTYNEDDELDFQEMIGKTNNLLLEGKGQTIAEASFSTDNLFCSVDLLHPVEDGYEIYEVKATTSVNKDHYIDAAFQKYVLEKRGLKIKNVYILHLNRDYIRRGELEINKLFAKEDITLVPEFLLHSKDVIEANLDFIQRLANQEYEPLETLHNKCKSCAFKDYCHQDIVCPSVLDINGLRNAYDYMNSGAVTFEDVLLHQIKLNKRQKVQVDAYLLNKDTIIDVDAVKEFLRTIRYPLYHLDFESIQLPIPPADGCWPYEQIPTQYSLHIEYEDGTLEHKEFLGDSIDPRRELAESLCKDIPMDGCVMVYNKTFECERLDELSGLYPDLRDHLLAIKNNVVDLLVPFKKGYFYKKEMGGSNSIKAVLPALCPNDPELDYHALPVVHKGDEAMEIYPKMLEADPNSKQIIRDGLLKYCCLDTLAMVKILQVLKSVK